MSYTQLTQDQRYQIYALKQAEQTNKRIAEILGVHASTVSRELKRNRGKKGYRPKQADEKVQERKHGAKRRIGSETWEYVEQRVKKEWSPEQVSGRLRSHHGTMISHEWIYQYILADICTSIYGARKGIARDMAAMRGMDLSQTAEVLKNGQKLWENEAGLAPGKAIRSLVKVINKPL